jgi:hypothetical protein
MTNARLRLGFLSLAVLLAIGGSLSSRLAGPHSGQAAPSSVAGVEKVLDHFKCWESRGNLRPQVVYLQDQFDISPNFPATANRPPFETVVVSNPQFFCNPTVKIATDIAGNVSVTQIVDEDDHLACYDIDEVGTAGFSPRAVTIENQFGRQGLQVIAPRLVCAPTQKLAIRDANSEDFVKPPVGGGVPRNLDHFKCYDVAGQPPARPIQLRDEFDRLRDTAAGRHIEAVDVGQPVLLCNPTRKVHFLGFQNAVLAASSINWIVVGVRHAEAHLVCYRIDPPESGPSALKAQNQFGSQELTVALSALLCVPSLKQDLGAPTPTPTPSCNPGTPGCHGRRSGGLPLAG